jgi:hypothetical protein
VATGVLDFTSVEGTVGIPSTVSRNLFGRGAQAAAEGSYVTITYRRLPKGVLALIDHHRSHTTAWERNRTVSFLDVSHGVHWQMGCLPMWPGIYVRFQPRAADFQREVGGDVRAVLEAALERHSTLTEGGWISVPFAGGAFELLVQKLRPGRAVSVIGVC